jgi:hypothetical protein
MLSIVRRIIPLTLVGVVCFALGNLWTASNPVLLPHDEIVINRFSAQAATDLARHFRWSERDKVEIRKRTTIAIREAGINCIVFATRPYGYGEWSYQACYSDEGRLRGLKAF